LEGVNRRQLRRANARHWDAALADHVEGFYDLAAFKAGACSLRSIELEEVGDVRGKSLLHLQCNCGIDTLSWARRGATVTGVDISAKAIAFARQLARDVSIDARFICCDVLGLSEVVPEAFDIVFASYGVLCWIDDLGGWARTAANHLTPGGMFFYVSFHPACWPYDEKGTIEYPYFHNDSPVEDAHQEDSGIVTYEWQWTVADIVNSLVGAGLGIQRVGEYPVCCYQRLPTMVQGADGWWRLPGIQHLPLTLSVRARKAAGG